MNAILFAIQQTGASANGGIESITQVMQRLKRHRPAVVTNVETPQTAHWRALGFETHVVAETASAGIRANPVGYAATLARHHRALRRLIRQSGARIVHANDPLAFQLALSAAKTSPGTKIALNLRDTLDPGRTPPRAKYRLLFDAADHIFFLSRDMSARWAAIAPNAARAASVTYSIVDPARFRPSPPPNGQKAVLVSGTFRPKKGQLDFLKEAAPAIAAGGAEIWLAGDFDPANDPYSAACAEAAAPLGEAVKFLGFRDDLPDLIRKCAVIAVPSRHEGLMRTMIEGMASGRPVVSFDVCSAREMLEQESDGAGIVVPMEDFAGMAEAILGYCTDRKRAAAAGAAGAAAARRLFDPETVAARYEEVYDRL